MCNAWRAIFATGATTEPDSSNDETAERAVLTTPLTKSGLTARALSGLEPLGVSTVGELLAVDPVAISNLRGVANATRLETSRRIKQWRARLGSATRQEAPGAETLMDAADLLLHTAAGKSPREQTRAAIASLLLGVTASIDPLATQRELAEALEAPVTPARAGQVLTELQTAWAKRAGVRALLDQLVGAVDARLSELGGVASPGELADAIAGSLHGDAASDPRLAMGLLRCALERRRALRGADEDLDPVALRRRDGSVTFIATSTELLDLAEALGVEADRLVGDLAVPDAEVVPAARTREALSSRLPATGVPLTLTDPTRLVQVASHASARAIASGTGELHTAALSPAAALRLTLAGFGGNQQIKPSEIRDRVAVRFPGLPALPERPTLDQLVDRADLGLAFDDRARAYRAREASGRTTGLETRKPTTHELSSAPVSTAGPIGVRLDDSVRSRSFAALGVRPERLMESVSALRSRYDADVVDLTALLIEALKAQTASGRPSWADVTAADAQAPGSRARAGLDELVRRAWPHVESSLEAAVSAGKAATPIVITDAAPLARYGHMDLLGRWTDLAAGRPRAVWLLVPQPSGNRGALLDGAPIPLAAPSQFVLLDSDWVDTTAVASAATKEP